MSDNESKMVLRAKIKSLKGMSAKDAYQFFSSRVSQKPDQDCLDNGEFHYSRHDMKEASFRPVYDGEFYGIEYLFKNEGDEYYPQYSLTLKEVNRIVDVMVEIFGVDPRDIKVLSYTWYNGTDEPFEF